MDADERQVTKELDVQFNNWAASGGDGGGWFGGTQGEPKKLLVAPPAEGGRRRRCIPRPSWRKKTPLFR